jgi:hypothetical protein
VSLQGAVTEAREKARQVKDEGVDQAALDNSSVVSKLWKDLNSTKSASG